MPEKSRRTAWGSVPTLCSLDISSSVVIAGLDTALL